VAATLAVAAGTPGRWSLIAGLVSGRNAKDYKVCAGKLPCARAQLADEVSSANVDDL